MSRPFLRLALVAASLATAATAAALPALDRSLEACVLAVADESGARRIDVVRRVDHFGSGNAEYWLNAEVEPAAKAYCRTRRDEITRVDRSPGHWRPTTALRPALDR